MSENGALFAGEHSRGSAVAPARWRRVAHELTVLPAALADGSWRGPGWLQRGVVALVALGLLTVSWDRLLNVQVASYNVKLPSLVFTVAAVLAMVVTRRPLGILLQHGPRRTVAVLTATIVLYEILRGVFSAAPGSALAQVSAVLSGAVLPAVALLLTLRRKQDLRWALRWLLAGALIASVFGLYQLLAFYVGLPQGIAYRGVGIGTSIGRISAFSYEPAYFAYLILLALGAYVTLRRLDGREVGWGALIAFAAVLYLANVRAVPLVAIAFGLLLLITFRLNSRLVRRGGIVLVVTLAVALVTPTVVRVVGSAIPQNAATQAVPAHSDSGRSPHPSSSPAGAGAIQSQLQAVNPDEGSSNGPRLGLYTAVAHEVAASPVFGLGPGNLGAALRRDAPSSVQDQVGGQVVANNIWLQALADGGIIQLLLELALVVAVAVAAIRRRASTTFPMAAMWLAVVGVGGMLTSYLFDIKVWVVLALVLVGFSVADSAPAGRSGPEGAAS